MKDEFSHSEIDMLTDAELDAINGGSIFGRIAHFLHDLFAGPGDHRSPFNAPTNPTLK
jgi:hypothetical protein